MGRRKGEQPMSGRPNVSHGKISKEICRGKKKGSASRVISGDTIKEQLREKHSPHL